MNKKEKLIQRLLDLSGEHPDKETGEYIEFFLEGKSLGKSILPTHSMEIQRHIIADMLDIKEYDDYHLIRKNGSIVKASSIQINGLKSVIPSYIDFEGEYGAFSNLGYQRYLKEQEKPICSCCGKAW